MFFPRQVAIQSLFLSIHTSSRGIKEDGQREDAVQLDAIY